ncbi:restriction endonuclease subunit S [Photobacterium swingsii]|uniref:restriction endonuclease subunit S n=1 Tax=Photobacterium swingsii TaxID=680026 RepID=UPI00406899F7
MTEQMNVPKLRFGDFSEQPQTLKLIELSEDGISNGVFNDPKKVGSGYRLINVKDMYKTDYIDTGKLTSLDIGAKEFGKNMVRYGDIFFTRSSIVPSGIAYSNVCLSRSNDITYDGHLMKLSPALSRVDPTYLSYKLRTWPMRTRLIRRGKQSTMTTIGQADIADIPVEMPTLPEQQKIAAFLSKVDEKIRLLSEKKDKLTEYKRGVMQQLFNGKWHEQDGQLTFVPPTLRFKADDGSEFPAWEEKRLGDVGSIVSGLTYSPDNISDDGVLVLRSSNIQNDVLSFKDNVYVSVEKFNPVIEGDILICVRNGSKNLIGKNTTITKDAEGLAFGAFMTVYRSKCSHYLRHYFRTSHYKHNVHKNLGATINSINGSDLKKFKVGMPCSSEQTKIAHFLTAIDQRIALTNSELDKAKEWKKGLLQQMFV